MLPYILHLHKMALPEAHCANDSESSVNESSERDLSSGKPNLFLIGEKERVVYFRIGTDLLLFPGDYKTCIPAGLRYGKIREITAGMQVVYINA